MEAAAVKAAASAAALGGAARVLVALHGGVRSWIMLAIEAGVGAVLGVAAAALVVWWDAGLRDGSWGWLIVSGAAGMAGALGTRLLDMATRAIEARLIPPGPKP